MPFDSTPIFDRLTFSPGREGLRKLAYVLRHKELWPADHVWNYKCCGQCAMGIANELWSEVNGINTFRMSQAFEITESAAIRIFIFARRSGQQMGDVGPEQVADAIDNYLAS